MPAIRAPVRRESTGNASTDNNALLSPPVYAFLSLLLLISCCLSILLYLRHARRRAQRQGGLPQQYKSGHHRTLTITTAPSGTTRQSIFVYDEKMNLIANSDSPPSSPVPEIHVTFPDEERRDGSNTQGRVVILRISDTGSVGLEPLRQEPLPPYQRTESERFQSLDLERIGGLKEKSMTATTVTVTPRYS